MNIESSFSSPLGSIDESLHFRLTALLKWRRRFFDKESTPIFKNALAILPFFFYSSFKMRGLDVAPPGIVGFKPTTRSFTLQKKLALPAELELPQDDRTIASLVGFSENNVLNVYITYQAGAKADALDRVKRRLPVIQSFLHQKGCPVRFFHWDTMKGAPKDQALHAILYKGFFVAGEIPQRFWQLPQTDITQQQIWNWFLDTQSTPLEKMALYFLLDTQSQNCGTLLLDMINDVPTPVLADKTLLLLLWAANVATPGNLLIR